ncbi:glutathione S-transferase [Acidobacteria bacterium Mor1]|nr:glutathione S-transferase [Acidobacteria bacterium Mor1]
MSRPTLYIANKNYSSWSLRPWIAMKVKGIPFEEDLQTFDIQPEERNPHFRAFSPTGKVPVLVDGDVTVWESLAILEYVAERHPAAGLWPAEPEARAVARAIAHEMHAGYADLRGECPMNMRRKPGSLAISPAVEKDIRRIRHIWRESLERSGGPFLFGDFGIVDAMFAPVVSRFEVYLLGDSDEVRRYSAAMTGLEPWKAWKRAAEQEPWTVESVEF